MSKPADPTKQHPNPTLRKDEKLTENFTLYELTKTGNNMYQNSNRMLHDDQYEKLKVLAEFCEEVRKIVGVPLKINSAYRSPQLNKIIGGSPTSQHTLLEAIDFVPVGLPLVKAYELIIASDLEYSQIILERRGTNPFSWIHIAISTDFMTKKGKHRQNLVVATNGKYMTWAQYLK